MLDAKQHLSCSTWDSQHPKAVHSKGSALRGLDPVMAGRGGCLLLMSLEMSATGHRRQGERPRVLLRRKDSE